MDAIDHIFAEFQLVYNNQYHKAFITTDKLQYAKKLWFSNLIDYSPEQILNAAHRAIKSSEYLPTIRSLLKYCEDDFSLFGLPDTRNAYIEACKAPEPKAEHQWSHPAVYYAGKASDWFFLANNIESRALPVFERNYSILCERVRKGEKLEISIPEALPETITTPLSTQQQQQQIDHLRDQLKN